MKKSWIVLFLLCYLCNLTGCGENVAADDSVTLKLACWIEDLELQQLVEMFEETHENVDIEITAYYSENVDAYAAMDRMNADLISGEYADLYYLENAIDVMSLVNAGLLADLKPLMSADADFNKEAYFSNVWELMEIHGSLYELPSGFQICAIVGSESILVDRQGWSIQDYQAFVSELYDPSSFLATSRTAMLSNMIAYAIFDYIDIDSGACSFDDSSFKEWLDFVCGFPENVDSNLMRSRMAVGTWIGGIYEYLDNRDTFCDQLTFVGFPNDSATGPCVQALTSYGISSQTEYTSLCWEFMKLMLSQDYQEVIKYSAFPMMREVFQSQLEACTLPADDSNSLLCDRTYTEPFSLDETAYLMNLVENLSQSAFRYMDIESIITEEAESYFCGDKSASDVMSIIQNRCSIYLEEKK